jgi:hypothetical protein
MWSARIDNLDQNRTIKVGIDAHSSPISFHDVRRAWQDNEEFRSFFISLLANAPFTAFRWETPPICTATAARAFEFVLLDSPGLAPTADPKAFAEYFAKPPDRENVVTFSNLGNDALLVVPCPIAPPSAYRHLATFVREAPEPQQHSLWVTVAKAMQQRLRKTPVWLSTAGAGVSWLHVRLDDRPKYYGYRPYRDAL